MNQFPEKWYLYPVNKEEYDVMTKWRGGNATGTIGYFCLDSDKRWKSEPKQGYTKITFEQFKKYVLKEPIVETAPEDNFSVVIENDNGKEIFDYLVSKGFNNEQDYKGWLTNGSYYYVRNKVIVGGRHGHEDLKSYTLNQLKSLNIKQDMKQEIVAYKLKPQFDNNRIHNAIWTICNLASGTDINDAVKYLTTINSLKEAGIFDIWFDPIYKQQYNIGDYIVNAYPDGFGWNRNRKDEVFKVVHIGTLTVMVISDCLTHEKGLRFTEIRPATPEEIEKANTKIVRMGGENGFNLLIKNGEVYHGSQHTPITNFVREIREKIVNSTSFSTNGYSCNIKEIVFSKTGCEHKETKSSEWIDLYNQLK